MRTALLGDVAGHLEALVKPLEALGVDLAAKRLPPDLTVVQVGDLVDRGPYSDAVVELVDEIMDTNPGRWIQLAGNHEAQYIGGPRFWPEAVGRSSQETLRRWHGSGSIRAAAAIRTVTGQEFVVSHAGVTDEYRRRHLDGSDDPLDVAARLNALLAADDDRIFSAGCALSHGRGSAPAPERSSPLWADAARELYPGWITGREAPWGQVHGHSAPYDWHRSRWRRADVQLERISRVDRERRHVALRISGRMFFAIDPDLRVGDVDVPVEPLVFHADLISS